MKKTLMLFLVLLLSVEMASAKVFYFADEVDRNNNIDYALGHNGVDFERVADFNNYACMSLNDYNNYANADHYDSHDALDASTASRDDLDRLRREDQLKIADADPYDSLDRDDVDNSYSDWNCYTLQDYNSLAAQNPYDRKEVVDFTDFDHLEESQRIGAYRYNNFFAPGDLNSFNLQNERARLPYYEPYDYRDSPYPLYGYGIRRIGHD
jgi:hypothetical protein